MKSDNIPGIVFESGYNNILSGEVFLVPMFNDNYGFLLIDPDTRHTVCVDPGDGNKIIEALKLMNLELNSILCTHKHNDHIGGNSILKHSYPLVKIIGTRYESIPEITNPVGDGDKFNLGNLIVEVFHTPCHTKGHVIYLVTHKDKNSKNPILFTGDTLFIGGCGRFFEGTATDMLKNMEKISSLDPKTFVFCAHEYTESNLKFLSSIDPVNCSEIFENVKKKRLLNIPTVPSQLREELKYNLFMKCHDVKTQSITKTNNAVSAMGVLRKWKNDFK